MFSRLRNTIDSIAPAIKNATTTASTIAQMAAKFTKRGCAGYVHITSDFIKSAHVSYMAAINADTKLGIVSNAISGFADSFFAGIYVDTAAEIVREVARLAAKKHAGKAVSRGSIGGILYIAGFMLVVGNLYESLRDTPDLTGGSEDAGADADFPMPDDTDIIDAEAHDHPDNLSAEAHRQAHGLDDDHVNIDIGGPKPADD